MSLYRSGSAAILTVALLAACQSDPSSDSKSAEDETAPIPVEVGLPVRGDVYAMYSGTAPIEAFAEADVIGKVGGEIRELLVEEGDEVNKGQILARLDGDGQVDLNDVINEVVQFVQPGISPLIRPAID